MSLAALRTRKWNSIFPKFNVAKIPQIVHPTAVYEDERGDLYTLKINGTQPKSSTDLFILW
jgi:hypothetical protein